MTRDDDDGLDSMASSMRSLWRELPDEDPPARGLDALMAAARSKAIEMTPEPEPWWKRAFAMLVRPPVLAACTALVLVGATVMLSRRDDAPVMATADSRDLSLREKIEDKERPTQGAMKDQAAPAPEATIAEPAAPGGTRNRTPPPRPRPPVKVPETVKQDPPRAEPPAVKSGDDFGAGVPEGAVVTGGAPSGNGSKRTQEAEEDKPTAVDALSIESTGGRNRPTSPTAGNPPTGNRAAPSEQLLKQAETAASRNDCAAVRATAERIRKADGRFYKDRVVTQPAIKRCL